MEAVAALSLACNVLQLLEVAVATVRHCKEIYRTGQTDSNRDVAEHAQHMSEATDRLSEGIKAYHSRGKVDRDDKEILSQAIKAQSLAEELRDALAKLEVDISKSRIAAVTRLIPSSWYAGKIKSLEEKLDRRQKALDTILIRDVNLRQRAVQIQQHQSFKLLDDDVQSFIKNLAEGCKMMQELLMDQGKETRALVSAESYSIQRTFQAAQDDKAKQADCDRFLESLRFDDMDLRRNQVGERHDKTFEWIFEPSTISSSCSLMTWLKEGEGVYWISGKPGSGKSTFMRFLCDDIRTQSSLEDWHKETMLISYFFWKSGSADQRSSKGLVISLLYQLLVNDAETICQFLKQRPQFKRKRKYNDWSVTEVTEILLSTLTETKTPLCILLDGLDEFDDEEGFDKISNLVDKLVSVNSERLVKACVSSRPETGLKRKFQSRPKLRLQDLTRGDIELCASDLLKEVPIEKRSKLVDIVVDSADGVFLWVHYALRSLMNGLTNVDDWDQLKRRLNSLPKKIEDLYNSMWLRLNDDESIYRQEAAKYFRIVLNWGKYPSVFQLMVASDSALQQCFLEQQSEASIEKMVGKCERLEQRIASCCAGLLEIATNRIGGSSDDYTYLSESIDESNNTNRASDEESTESDYNDLSGRSDESNNTNNEDVIRAGHESPEGSSTNDEISSENQSDHVGSAEGDNWNNVDLTWSQANLHKSFAARKVVFIHRTASDFLIDTAAGGNILRHFNPPVKTWPVLQLRVRLVAMLAGIKRFSWPLAEKQLYDLIQDEVLGLSDEDDHRILSFMHQAYQRLTPRSDLWEQSFCSAVQKTLYCLDFLGLTLTFGFASYLHKVMTQITRRFRIQTTYLNYLLICSSVQREPVTNDVICYLLHNGADPNAQGFVHSGNSLGTKTMILPLASFLFDVREKQEMHHLPGRDRTCGHRMELLERNEYIQGVTYIADTINCFVAAGLDLSKKLLVAVIEGLLFHPVPLSRAFGIPFVIYETTVGDVINYAVSHLNLSNIEGLHNGKDYAKDRKVVLVHGEKPPIRCRAIASKEDADLLSDKLNTFLFAISGYILGKSYEARDNDRTNWPEWVSLTDCVKEVWARGEHADEHEILIEMGHAEGGDPEIDLSPMEPFESIADGDTDSPAAPVSWAEYFLAMK